MAKRKIAEAMDIAIAQVQQEAAAAPPVGLCGFCGKALTDPVAGLCAECDADVTADADGTMDADAGDSGASDDRFCKGCQAELSADHDGDVCEECAEEIAAGRCAFNEQGHLVSTDAVTEGAAPQSAATEPAADAAPAAEPTQVERDMRQPSLFPPSPFDYERAFDAIASGRRLLTARREEWEGAKSRAASAKRLHDEAAKELEDRIRTFESRLHEAEVSKERFDRALVAQEQRDQQQEAQPGDAGSVDGSTPAVVPEAASTTDSTEDSMSDETTQGATEETGAAETTSEQAEPAAENTGDENEG